MFRCCLVNGYRIGPFARVPQSRLSFGLTFKVPDRIGDFDDPIQFLGPLNRVTNLQGPVQDRANKASWSWRLFWGILGRGSGKTND